MKTRTIAMAVLALADLTACGGDSGTPTDAEPDDPGIVAVSTVVVSPATATISAGGTQQFTATLLDAAGNTITGRTVTWSSSNMAIATVNSSTGLATGVAPGTATITGTSEGKTGAATLTVPRLDVQEIAMHQSIYPGFFDRDSVTARKNIPVEINLFAMAMSSGLTALASIV